MTVLDDYAHHPAEIAATIEAVRNGGRVLVLFQPHLYSRTRHLVRELATRARRADVVAVTEIYGAREEPVEGVSGKLVVDALTRGAARASPSAGRRASSRARRSSPAARDPATSR